MDISKLYSLRKDFTVIGLTGRTGSGCSKIADLFSSELDKLLEEVRKPSEFEGIFKLKYKIIYDYITYEGNWIPFTKIKYVDVLLFYITNHLRVDLREVKKLLSLYYYKDKEQTSKNEQKKLENELLRVLIKHSILITEIKNVRIREKMLEKRLIKLEALFFSSTFEEYKRDIFKVLEDFHYVKTRILLHKVSCHIRKTGHSYKKKQDSIDNIFKIANLINQLIKAKRIVNKDKPTKIVIDSLRNSLEMSYFKERYASFYMVSTKDVSNRIDERLEARLKEKNIDESKIKNFINEVKTLDATEYRTKDYQRGQFSSPDVENCIQMSDYHLYNLEKKKIEEFCTSINQNPKEGFYSRAEQIIKLVALLHQPGIITPSPSERIMQIAHTAELNSGCISRRVGAVVTNSDFSVRSIGWNDVPKGQTPCNVRTVVDLIAQNSIDKEDVKYSSFEKGVLISHPSSYKYQNEDLSLFPAVLADYFSDSYTKRKDDLMGRPVPFCFKTIHNHYEGESNQIHTRSLHAEENAMLQLAKNGGSPLTDGLLFTTASPCELCSKKAYQLGIIKIYYIDPYPGISRAHILGTGLNSPVLIPFTGAVGNVYHRLYELFTPQKDEISMILEIKNGHNLSKKIRNTLDKKEDSVLIEKIKMKKTDLEIKDALKAGMK